MKARRILVLLVLAALLLVGCSNTVNDWDTMWNLAQRLDISVDDPQIRQLTESMLNAIKDDDADAAYNLFVPGIDRTQFDTVYLQFRQLLKDMGDYTLVASNIYKNTNAISDVTITKISYMLSGDESSAEEIRAYVDVAQSSEYPQRLYSFHINGYEEVTQTGTFTTMKGAAIGQWVMMIIGLLETAFMVWMFVDCCAHKVRKKWFWLLLIALGVFVISASVDSGFHLNFNVGLYLNVYTAAIAYSNGAYLLRIMVPVGAIVYLIRRKALFAKAVQVQPEQAAPVEVQLPAEETKETEE